MPIEPKTCGIVFEEIPAWLWSIRLSDFSQVFISQRNELMLRQRSASTWSYFESKLVVTSEAMVGLVVADIWFVSGSRSFLEAQAVPESTPVVAWLYPTGRQKPENSCNTTWIKIAHSQVGGVSNMTGTFCIRHLPAIQIEVDPISRSIEHIIKHSERPIPCGPELTAIPHYRLSDRLSRHHLGRTVLLPTGFSRTGWGQRPLVASELGHAFDLPSYVPWDDTMGSNLVPLQVFRVVMDHVLAALSDPTEASTSGRLPTPAAVIAVDPLPSDDTFLPLLNTWLPGSWADTAIADRAVKADNARIDFSPWNRRITLVLPCNSLTIERFEVFGLRLWRRALVRSFVSYLSTTYGSSWRQQMGTTGGSSTRKRALSFKDEDHQPSLTKKTCVESVGGRQGGVLSSGNGVSSRAWEAKRTELVKDVIAGRAVVSQALAASWWDWSSGSLLMFWRWNGQEQRQAARDGMEIFIQSPLPRGRQPKRVHQEATQRQQVSEKIEGMLKRSYLETGFVSSTLHFFPVPKGDTDIRVVFDGTLSGLNETLWAPNFYLPTAKAAALHISYSSWMSDMDCGEMFHNFFMDKRVRKCAGLQLDNNKSKKSSYLRWSRVFMGMRPSPYIAVRHYYWAEEFAKGDPSLPGNPMAYNRIILNLPGMSDYNPALPKVMKWNEAAQAIAGDVITFVDYVRVTGFSKENFRSVHHQFASRIQYLGMQDAPRKFRPPSQSQAGAWTGTIFKITGDAITKSVAPEKWDKGTNIIARLQAAMEEHCESRPLLDRKLLERETGFLNHLAMTFEVFVPFLKGFYLTLNSWRSGRDAEDWKMPDKQWHQVLWDRFHEGKISEEELDSSLRKATGTTLDVAPAVVKASHRLVDDLCALSAIFKASSGPPQVNLRSKRIVTVIYGFGDASGSGLGATFTCGVGFTFRIGVWGATEQLESSNWKEFSNVVESLEEEAEEGNLKDAEVFMFTDNTTVEACAEKGSSSSKKLLGLIVRLQALSTQVLGVKIHIFHVAGTRMIAQGTDGVSRGYLAQGVMAGDAMSVHIPIYLSAVERAPPNLVHWIRNWAGREAELLDSMGWFQRGHDISGWKKGFDGFHRPELTDSNKCYIWAPPPFAADVAIAELRKARIKRQTSSHIFICPRLCTTLWQRQLYRCADFVFEVPVGSHVWPQSMHEPLLIGLLFPFLRVKPWQLRGTPKMHAMGRELRNMFQSQEMDPGDLLRKFWSTCLELQYLPEGVVRKMLYFQ